MSEVINHHENFLLAAMVPADLDLLAPHFEDISLEVATQLVSADTGIEHVYFLESGSASILGGLPNGRKIEVAIVGREGMTGGTVVLGDSQSPNATFIQIGGRGQRLRVSVLIDAMAASGSLKALLLLYVQSLLFQTTTTAIANGHISIDGRLSRCLLMVHDRMRGSVIPLTHEMLALKLGVTRPGVTTALHSLEGQGLIRSGRGRITILSRIGLTISAQGSYGAAEKEYSRLLGRQLSR
jgi:CRP-like cAMP-binding protein